MPGVISVSTFVWMIGTVIYWYIVLTEKNICPNVAILGIISISLNILMYLKVLLGDPGVDESVYIRCAQAIMEDEEQLLPNKLEK